MNRKKIISCLLALATVLSLLTACGGSGNDKTNTPGSSGDTSKTVPAINEIKLGEDYQDITAEVKVLTNRTDIVDTVYAGYAEAFNKLYPNITVSYEGISDYEEALNLRLPNGDWGDICFIPSTVAKSDMSNYFIPLGDMNTLNDIYQFIPDKSYNGTVYGIANGGNADGVAYNKKVFEAAGYTKDNMPSTPSEFMQALRDIKSKTDAIPLYTNFADKWPMGAWDAYIAVAATGDQDFRNYKIVHMANPFADRDDETGPYAVYSILYNAVAEGLVEADPMSSDWEGCKGMINRGEIGAIVLGSWSVQQFKDAGDNPDDVAYMPFPITVKDAEGNRVTSAGGNYSYAINCKTSADQQIASLLYVKWLLEESTIFTEEGCIPALKSAPMPDFLADFDGIELLSNNPAPEGEEDYTRWTNPVLTREMAPLHWRYDLNPETNPFFMERLGVNAAFNAGAIELNGKFYLVARMEGNDRKSFFAVAESDSGVDGFRFWDYPVVLPDTCQSETNVYDMRLTKHEDGWIYGVFCSESKDTTVPDLSAAVAAAGIVRTRDLKTWERLPNLVTLRSPQQRNVCLLPEFVDGKYAFYTRPMDDFIDTGSGGGIGFGLCDDITNAVIDEEIITSPRRYHTITESKNGSGAVPFKTDRGWIHIAHGVRNTAAGLRYVIYAYATDLKEPWKVVAEPGGFLIAPLGAERVGDVSNVVFTNGAIVRDNGDVYIYYASDDTRLHVATTTVERLVDYVFNTPADALRSADCVKQRCELIDRNLEYLRTHPEN